MTTTDDRRCVQRLLALARRPLKGAVPAPVSHPPVVIGAGMAPGLTCLLVRAAARELETVDEIHVAKSGTGGPACARVHHHALAGRAMDWRDGLWIEREAGTGRELCWFPEPVRALDCYRADLADPLLIVPAFPGVERVTSRVAATRRDRLTSRLPMLRPPHPEGQTGAVRVEVRGTRHGARHGVVLGVSQAPAVATAAVAAIVAVQLGTDPSGFAAVGGLALAADPLGLLDAVQARGLTVERFEGVDARTAW